MLFTNTNHEDRDDSLSDLQAKLARQGAPSDVVFAWMEKESCSITEDVVVDVGILHDRAGIVPLAVENETDSQECRCDQQRPKWRNVFLPVVEALAHRPSCIGDAKPRAIFIFLLLVPGESLQTAI